MIIDIDKTQERFQFFTSSIDAATGEIIYNDPDGDAWVTLQPMGQFIEERLLKRKKVYANVLNSKTRQMERISYYPELSQEEEKAEREELWDYVIVNFEGFKDKSGKAIDCTKENKMRMLKVPMFDRFISKCLEIMASAGITAKDTEEKNLSPGSSSKTNRHKEV